MFSIINDFITDHADNPWVLVIVALCTVIDGFFPPIPSESLVVGLSAISASTGTPPWWGLLIVAAGSAWLGDNIAYLIGRQIGVRWLSHRWPRLGKVIGWAERQLERRGAMIIIVARFIPGGRVAVNATCGAGGFGHKRFMGLTTLSGVAWASYSVALGTLAGAWLADNPLLAATIGIIGAVILGVIVDQILQRLFPYRPEETESPITDDAAGAEDDADGTADAADRP